MSVERAARIASPASPRPQPGFHFLFLILILFLTPSAKAAPESPATLQFLDGATLHGSLTGLDTNLGLHWQHPDALNPFTLQPAHVDVIRFNHSQSMSNSPACQFHFANGDDLFGSLVSLGEESAELATWFGGTLKVPRASIQSITYLPANYALLYEGPGEPSEWVVGGAQGRIIAGNGVLPGNVFIFGGGIVNIGGITYTSGTQNNTPPWTWQDGGYLSTGQGTLGRDFHLHRSSTIEFDLSCPVRFNLMVNLYAPAVDRLELNNTSVSLSLDNDAGFRRPRSTWTPRDLGSVSLPDFDKRGAAHITIHCNKDDGSVTLLQDGRLVQHWTDLGGFEGLGGCVVFQNQIIYQSLPGNVLKLSNFRASEWDGPGEPDSTPVTATNTDTVSFLNHDSAQGKIEGVADGKLNLQLAGHLLHVPSRLVAAICFAQSSAPAEPRGPWEVRALFPGGGSISFQMEKWDNTSVTGRNALFGPVSFPTSSIRQLQFNLNHPKENAALSVENEFDVLDQ